MKHNSVVLREDDLVFTLDDVPYVDLELTEEQMTGLRKICDSAANYESQGYSVVLTVVNVAQRQFMLRYMARNWPRTDYGFNSLYKTDQLELEYEHNNQPTGSTG